MSTSDGTDLDEVGPSGRDLEPRHRDVDDGRLAPERPPLPLDGAAAAGRPRADGGRRRAARSGAVDQRNAEIYSPPYLFKGPRPTITTRSRDDRVRRELRRDDAERGEHRQGLADPAPVGHARARPEPALPVPELHARRREGDRSAARRPRTSRRRATTCSSSLNANGVPSVAAIVRVSRPPRTRRRRPRRRTCVATAPPGQVTLSLGGVDRRRRRRALQRPPLDHCRASRRARRTGSRSRRERATRTSASPPGTYYYKVTAEDLAGNVGPPSNEASATVAGGSARLVAPTASTRAAGTTTADQIGRAATTGRSSNTTWAERRGQVRQRALVQRLELVRDGRRLELARPDDRA